jgi:hypothetical protein
MPRYFFDIKDGHRLVDPAGRECKNDTAAKEMGKALAIVVSVDGPRSIRRGISLSSTMPDKRFSRPRFIPNRSPHNLRRITFSGCGEPRLQSRIAHSSWSCMLIGNNTLKTRLNVQVRGK